MPNTKQLVAEILAQPQARLIVEQVSDALAKEQQKRQQFYEMIDEDMKAEFVNGEIIIHSPVKKRHNDATKRLFKLLDTFVEEKRLGFVGIEKIMISLTRNDYEPDICFFRKEKSEAFKPNQVLFPTPDFVVEILSDGNTQHDRVTKFMDYEEHGVEEYWIVDPDAEDIEQYHLQMGKYQLILKAKESTIESYVVAGFKMPIRAVFDPAINNEALRHILAGI